MKINLWCSHSKWMKGLEEGQLFCQMCHASKLEGQPDPQVKIAWGFAKEESVVAGGKQDRP